MIKKVSFVNLNSATAEWQFLLGNTQINIHGDVFVVLSVITIKCYLKLKLLKKINQENIRQIKHNPNMAALNTNQ